MDEAQHNDGARDRTMQPETETAAEEDAANMDKSTVRSDDQQDVNQPRTAEDATPARPKRRGRPPVDVFRRPGARSSFFSLGQWRSIFLGGSVTLTAPSAQPRL